jgi:biotin transport system ATP-binding protein
MPDTRPILEVSNLSRRFPDMEDSALDGVSFTVKAGEFIVISGANGSGKSVLMALIAGLDEPTGGTVRISEIEGTRTLVGLVFQDADAQILGDTIEEDVAFGPKNLGIPKAECEKIVARVLAHVGLEGREKSPARSLSGGEKRRLAVAGILAIDAGIIIFDEPFANLDWPGVVQVNGILQELKAEGKTVIILTHELEKVLALASRLMVLFRGKLVWDGKPDAALESAPLAGWGIRPPLVSYTSHGDLFWGSDGTSPGSRP